MNYVNKKWQFELTMPEGWTVNESMSSKLLPRGLAMAIPTGVNVMTALSPFGPALNIRAGRKLMSILDISRMSNRVNYYSRGGADIAGADGVHYFSYDTARGMKVCKVTVQRGNVQFDVTVRGEEDPPEWFVSGWRFI